MGIKLPSSNYVHCGKCIKLIKVFNCRMKVKKCNVSQFFSFPKQRKHTVYVYQWFSSYGKYIIIFWEMISIVSHYYKRFSELQYIAATYGRIMSLTQHKSLGQASEGSISNNMYMVTLFGLLTNISKVHRNASNDVSLHIAWKCHLLNQVKFLDNIFFHWVDISSIWRQDIQSFLYLFISTNNVQWC